MKTEEIKPLAEEMGNKLRFSPEEIKVAERLAALYVVKKEVKEVPFKEEIVAAVFILLKRAQEKGINARNYSLRIYSEESINIANLFSINPRMLPQVCVDMHEMINGLSLQEAQEALEVLKEKTYCDIGLYSEILKNLGIGIGTGVYKR